MMPAVGSLRPVLPWPYIEGLRMDEAMNPLTLLTFGFYGKKLWSKMGPQLDCNSMEIRF